MTAALVEQLRGKPDDIHAWQVFADWLIEQGDPRGDLVRLPRRLTTQEVSKWRGVIPAKAATRWLHGFVIEIEVPFDARAPHTLATIFADPASLLVGSLRLRDGRHWGDEDFHVDPKREVEETPDLFAAICGLDLRHIRALAFRGCELGAAGVDVLAAGRVGPLVSLDLRYCKLGDDGVVQLVASKLLDGVRSLYLQRNGIGERGARTLAASEKLRALELLDLRFNAIGTDGARAIAESPHFGRLAKLLLYPDDIGGEGVQALAASSMLPRETRRYWRARS